LDNKVEEGVGENTVEIDEDSVSSEDSVTPNESSAAFSIADNVKKNNLDQFDTTLE